MRDGHPLCSFSQHDDTDDDDDEHGNAGDGDPEARALRERVALQWLDLHIVLKTNKPKLYFPNKLTRIIYEHFCEQAQTCC